MAGVKTLEPGFLEVRIPVVADGRPDEHLGLQRFKAGRNLGPGRVMGLGGGVNATSRRFMRATVAVLDEFQGSARTASCVGGGRAASTTATSSRCARWWRGLTPRAFTLAPTAAYIPRARGTPIPDPLTQRCRHSKQACLRRVSKRSPALVDFPGGGQVAALGTACRPSSWDSVSH